MYVGAGQALPGEPTGSEITFTGLDGGRDSLELHYCILKSVNDHYYWPALV